MNKVIANYNMSFNEGHFKKGNTYSYEYEDDDNNFIIVTTEEGRKTIFTFEEFHVLFSFLTI